MTETTIETYELFMSDALVGSGSCPLPFDSGSGNLCLADFRNQFSSLTFSTLPVALAATATSTYSNVMLEAAKLTGSCFVPGSRQPQPMG